MRVRTSGLPILLIAILFGLGCDGPGYGWPGTDEIDADVVRIQELAAERVAAGETPPKGPADLVVAPEPSTPPPAAADPEPKPEPEPEPLVPDADRGAAIYAMNCSSCHGAEGRGDGPAGAALQPPPTNHTDGAYMNTLDNDHLYKVVYEGGAAVGKSATMAPWGAVLGEAQVWDVVAHMRAIAEPGYEGSIP